jgi:hypothetical protein
MSGYGDENDNGRPAPRRGATRISAGPPPESAASTDDLIRVV